MRLHEPCLEGVPIVGRNQYGYITLAFIGSPWWGEFHRATSALPCWGAHSGETSIRIHHPWFPGAPIVGGNRYGYINPTLSGSGEIH